MHLLSIYINPVKKGRKVDLCKSVTTDGDIVSVQEHLNNKLMQMAK